MTLFEKNLEKINTLQERIQMRKNEFKSSFAKECSKDNDMYEYRIFLKSSIKRMAYKMESIIGEDFGIVDMLCRI